MGNLLPVIVGLAVGITMVVSFAVLMPSAPSLQIYPAGRVWMALDIGQCAHPWESFIKKLEPGFTKAEYYNGVRQYFIVEHDLTIHEINSIKNPRLDETKFPGLVCHACGCYGGTLEALIDWGEMDKARELGFYSFERSPEQS